MLNKTRKLKSQFSLTVINIDSKQPDVSLSEP